ncbi:SDR family oxidoreductase [Spirosoma sp. 209]|uniref:SDR family oxidoreductase n=1 Tax=Spirosoma sp. 209 TaxID=1955701 RepID=UPI00098D3119|nr:SDR family oxidoreductase [Spirosoma sp. 209]
MKICLLTGCASGIGRHLTGVLLREGYSVAATDVAISQLHQAARTDHWPADRTLLLPLNVRSETDWQYVIRQTLDRWQRIDIGLNIAGVIRPGYVATITQEDIDFMVDVNLKGVMLGTRYLAELMIRQQTGHIINIASLAGLAPVPGLGIYSATKFAVRAFSLAAAGELRPQGVAVSVICPDLVDTDMLTQQLGRPEAALSFSGSRVLTVQDVERAVLQKAIARRQLEIMIPNSRGWLGKIGNLFPKLGLALTNRLIRKGLARQQQLR